MIRLLGGGHVWRRHSVTVERYVVVLGRTVMLRLRLPHPIDVARLLPRWLRRWSFVDIVGTASSGRYDSTEVPDLPAMEALRRWDGEHTP